MKSVSVRVQKNRLVAIVKDVTEAEVRGLSVASPELFGEDAKVYPLDPDKMHVSVKYCARVCGARQKNKLREAIRKVADECPQGDNCEETVATAPI